MPNWSDIHPVVVHFPIALLFVAPLFAIIAALTHNRSYDKAFSILLMLGTLGLIVAAASGEAAAEKISSVTDSLLDTLDSHESLAEQSRNIFIIICLMVIPRYFLTEKLLGFFSRIRILYTVLIIGIYCFGLLTLSLAAHHGGGLVHHHGIHSGLYDANE